MNSITVIRVEHDCGLGPYRDYHRTKPISKPHEDTLEYFATKASDRILDMNVPIILVDNCSIYKDNKDWYCAFKSVNDLLKYIYPEEIAIMYNHDYKVLQLEITEYQIGIHQILYTKKSIINSKDITNQIINHNHEKN